MATIDSPDRRGFASSPSRYGSSYENALPFEATSTDDTDFNQARLPPPPPPVSIRPKVVSLDSSTASFPIRTEPDTLHRHHTVFQSSWPTTPRPASHDARQRPSHTFSRFPPPPPPPPPGVRTPVPTMLLHLPPPPPPPPPALDTNLKEREQMNPMQRSLSPSMSLSSGSWHQEYTSSDSETSSLDADYFEQQNRAIFPPLLPSAQGRTLVKRERKQMTDSITDKVSRLENSRSSVPSLVDSDASSAASVASMEDDRVQELWVQMKERRQRLNTLKQDMATRRKALQDLRRRKDEADNIFMNMLRPILIKDRQSLPGTSGRVLDKRFAEMQSLRTEYHFLESGYEGLEYRLDEEEDDLISIETHFFSLLAAGSRRNVRPAGHLEDSDDDEAGAQISMPYELAGISRHGPSDDAHPLWEDLVSAIGDLDNAKEEYDDLLLRRNHYAYNVEIKMTTGKKPNMEEVEFMDEFPKDEREKRECVDRLTEEIGRLKQICEQKGAMKKHPSFRIACALYPNIGEDLSLDSSPAESGTLAHWRFPELLSRPDHVLRPEPLTAMGELKRAAKLPANNPARNLELHMAQKEYGISRLISEFKDKDKSDFITRWLLHQLRTSPLAVELLYSTFVQTFRLKVQNAQRWQQDVLFHWWRDGAVRSPEEFFGPLTGSGRVWPGHEAPPEHTSLPPERDVQFSTPPRAATEDWSRGSRQVYEDTSWSTVAC